MLKAFVINCAVFAACAVVSAQDDPSLKPKETQSVYVRDSATATEKLALAERMERLKEWERSADVYQEITQKLADRVVASHVDEGGVPTQYVSVVQTVQERIAKWPAEGLAIYRRRFEDTARDMLNAAPDDRANCRRVLSQYFATDAGKDAGLQLIAGAFERGEFSTAAWIGHRLLNLHPALIAERPRVLFETALAENLNGDDAAAQALLQELKTRYPNENGTVRGTDVNLATTLENELKSQHALPTAYVSEDWPNPFGSLDAAAVPASVSAGGAKLFSIDLANNASRNASLKQYQKITAPNLRAGAMTGILPAIDGGTLFFQDNVRLYAIDLASGLSLPGWSATYPGDKRGVFSIEGFPSPPGNQLAVSVRGDRVVALMGQSIAFNNGNLQEGSQPQLVCLNRNDGKHNWSATMAKAKLPDELAKLHDYDFYGTPVVTDDSVYTLLHSTTGGQFEECYLISFKLTDGSFQWCSYVSSTSGGVAMLDFQDTGRAPPGTTAQIAYANDRIYVLTNQGAIACLNADDGQTLWLDIYPRSIEALHGARPRFIRDMQVVKPFTINPPIISRGRVFVMPSDGMSAFVYDANTGETIAQVPRKLDSKYDPAEMLLAAVGDRLVMGNRNMLFVVPWHGFDQDKSLLDNGGMFRDFAAGDPNEKDAICGRPFVSEKYVLIPTADKLYRMTLDQFKFESVYPADGKWDDDESPGNVIATPDNLVIAGPTRVMVYTDLTAATAKLDTRITQNPDDIEAYLHYGELFFAAAKPSEAIEKLDQAIARMSNGGKLNNSPLRDRLFEIIEVAAAKLQKKDAPSAEVMAKLFDRAKTAASTPQQQVRYLLTQAAYFRKTGAIASELDLDQQILSDGNLRSASAVDKGGASTAGAVAAQSINELIEQNGVQVYAAYESKAFERLTAQKQANPTDPEKLVAIADEFPASKQTPEILSLASTQFESMHQSRRATQTLRRLLKSGIPVPQKAAVLESLARNYLAMPNQLDIAMVRLKQAGEISPDAKLTQPLILADGRTLSDLTLTQAVQSLKSFRDTSAQALFPQLGVLPTSDGSNNKRPPFTTPTELGAASAIVAQQENLARNDRVVVITPDKNQLCVYDVASAKSLWPGIDFGETPIGCAYSGNTLVVVGSSRAIVVDADGKKQWDVSLASLPAAEVPAVDEAAPASDATEVDINIPNGMPLRMRRRMLRNGRFPINPGINVIPIPDDTADEPAKGEQISRYCLLSDRLILITSSGRVVSLDLLNGSVTWQAHLKDQAVSHFATNDDFIAIAYSAPQTSDVYVLDAITGGVVLHDSADAANGAQQSTLENLAMSPDGVLVKMQANHLLARDLYDLSTPQWTWSSENAANPVDLPFITSSDDNQLVITGEYVLALSRANNGLLSIRPFSLRKLEQLTVHDQPDHDVPVSYASRVLPNNADNSANGVEIKTVGPAFYVWGARSLAAYNVERQDNGWYPASTGAIDHGLTRDFVITKDYAVQINQIASVNINAPRVPAIELALYSRALAPSGAESGVLEHRTPVRDPAGFAAEQWQIADGAFFYVSGDQKLKVIRANR